MFVGSQLVDTACQIFRVVVAYFGSIGKDQHAALGDDELRTLDRLQNRSLPNTTYSSSFSGEGMEDKCIKVWLNFNIPNNLAKLEMNIQAYENGLGYMIIIEFTVIALSGKYNGFSVQIS